MLGALHDKLIVDPKLKSSALATDTRIFTESIFPSTFGTAAMDCYMESQENYSALFGDQVKYNAIKSVLAGMVYREMHVPVGTNKESIELLRTILFPIIVRKGGIEMGKKNYAYVNHEMLVWARSETPFTSVEDVVPFIKEFSAEKLSAWESGTDLPSVTEAKRLAALYRVPFACFFLSSPPEKRVKKYKDRRTMFGTVYGQISYELWREINRIQENRDKLVDLLEPEEADAVAFKLTASVEDVEETGRAIREYFGISVPFKNKSAYNNNAYNYYRRLLENRGIAVSQISGVSLDEMRGLSISYDICPVIGINNRDFERAKVFSLFHEVAHLVRRSSSLCTIDFDERNDEEEKICDRIAAATLLPRDEITSVARVIYGRHNEWSTYCLQDIGDKFGVSSLVVLRRLYDIGIIERDLYFNIYDTVRNDFEKNRELIEQNRRGKNIPVYYYVKYLNQQGFLFPKVVLNAHANGKITYGEMCRTLSVNSKHVGDIERMVMFT